jgi:hypothetical protein
MYYILKNLSILSAALPVKIHGNQTIKNMSRKFSGKSWADESDDEEQNQLPIVMKYADEDETFKKVSYKKKSSAEEKQKKETQQHLQYTNKDDGESKKIIESISLDDLVFKNEDFLKILRENIGEDNMKKTPFKYMTTKYFKENEKDLVSIFIGKEAKYIKEIVSSTLALRVFIKNEKFNYQTIDADGKKSSMRTETLNCLEITYTSQCPFAKKIVHTKVQERFYKVIWDYYVNFVYKPSSY